MLKCPDGSCISLWRGREYFDIYDKGICREPCAANAVWCIVIMNLGNLDHRHLNHVLRQCFGATCIPRWIDAGEDGAFAHEDIGASANHDLTIHLYDTEMVRTGPAVERILATSPKTPLLTIANMTANFIG